MNPIMAEILSIKRSISPEDFAKFLTHDLVLSGLPVLRRCIGEYTGNYIITVRCLGAKIATTLQMLLCLFLCSGL